MLKVADWATLPWASVALQVTRASPTVKKLPEAGEQDAVPDPSTRSDVAGDEYVTINPRVLFVVTVISAWAAITGPVVSTTWTTKLVGMALFSFESVALQVTVVLPKAKNVPEAGVQDATPSPSTTSEVAGLA